MVSDFELIGNSRIGVSYSGHLSVLLEDARLTEATIASAYLTKPAASFLLEWLCFRNWGRHKPRIRIAIGSMNGFTRKAAIQSLLQYSASSHSARARSFPVHLEVVHPRERLFHVKAGHFRLGARKHVALLGSHNLTGSGLRCEGELGVRLGGQAAAKVGEALETWTADAVDWRAYLPTYREGVLPKDLEKPVDRSGAGTSPTLPRVAPPFTAGEEISAREIRLANKAIHKLEKLISRKMDHAWIWNTGETKEKVRSDGYLDGALCDVGDDNDEEWSVGKDRQIIRVEHVLPVDGNAESILLYTTRKKYRVTGPILARARKLGLTRSDKPKPERLLQFLEFLRRRAVV